jgi:hypothetical protein
MTFLNPIVLFALAAAAIPLILHLINLRKLRTIEFSSIAFLKELRKTSIRRLKIRQLLLMILRTLLVLLLVFAFARPTLRGKVFESLGSRARASVVVLVDDSQSMTGSDAGGEYLKQAREAARNILGFLEDDDEVTLLPLSTLASRLENDSDLRTQTPGAALALLENLRPSAIHRKLQDGVRLAARVLSSSVNFSRELYVISDFQEGLLAPQEASPPESLFPPEVRVFLLPVGVRDQRNLGIVSIKTANTIFEIGKPFTVDVAVHNASGSDVENHLMSLFLNGTRVAQKTMAIRSGETASATFSAVPTRPGFQSVMAEIESDDLEFDNRRFLALNIPEKTRVLLIGNRMFVRYVELALATLQHAGTALELVTVPAAQLSVSMVHQADVIFLINPSDLSVFQAEQLRAFVHAGGGMAVFADPQVERNRSVFDALGLPAFLAVETVGAEGGFLEFERAELRHAVFEGMFEETSDPARRERGRILESPRVLHYATTAPDDRWASVISLSNGAPFLLEEAVGSGKVLLYTAAPVPEWSDFPLKGLFVPLLHRTVAYCSQERVKQPDVVAGGSVRIPRLTTSGTRMTLITPSGLEAPVLPEAARGRITIENTEETGLYSLKQQAQVLAMISVNGHPAESRTRRADPDAWEQLFEHLGISSGVTTITSHDNVTAAVMEVRHGIELWKHFLVAALLVALAEMVVARATRAEVENSD